MTHDELRKMAEDTLEPCVPPGEHAYDLASGVVSLLDELAEARDHPTSRFIDEVKGHLATTRAALGEAAEALVLVEEWTREGIGTEGEAADALDTALANPVTDAALADRRKAEK